MRELPEIEPQEYEAALLEHEQRLYELTGTAPGERWSSSMRNDFHAAYMRFSNCYHRLGGGKLPITTGDAFLIYL